MCLSRIFVSHPQVFNFKGGFAQSKNAQFRLFSNCFVWYWISRCKVQGKVTLEIKFLSSYRMKNSPDWIFWLESQSSLPKTNYVYVKCKYHHIAVDVVLAYIQCNGAWIGSCILSVSHFNKTIGDGGITVDFCIIKVHSFHLNHPNSGIIEYLG